MVRKEYIYNLIRGINEPYKGVRYLEKEIYKRIFAHLLMPTIDRSTLKNHHNIKYWEFDEEESHEISVPDTIKDRHVLQEATKRWLSYKPYNRKIVNQDNNSGYIYSYQMNSHAPFVAELSNVTLYGPYGLIRLYNGKYPIDIWGGHRDWAHELFGKTVRDWGRTRTLRTAYTDQIKTHREIHSATTMLNVRSIPNQMAYGHWLTEALTKIRGVYYYYEKNGRMPYILIDPHSGEWQRELLLLLGINKENIIVWDGEPTRINNYILPRWGKNEYCRSDLKWISKKIEMAVDYDQYLGSFSNHIYLSRQGMNKREVVNREEVMSMLNKYGFESYIPSNLSFPEQVALFKQADIVVGPNGSAFANMIFAADATAIQMYPPNYFKYRLYEINNVLNHNCYPILGDRPDSGIGHNANFSVSVNELETLVSKITN